VLSINLVYIEEDNIKLEEYDRCSIFGGAYRLAPVGLQSVCRLKAGLRQNKSIRQARERSCVLNTLGGCHGRRAGCWSVAL